MTSTQTKMTKSATLAANAETAALRAGRAQAVIGAEQTIIANVHAVILARGAAHAGTVKDAARCSIKTQANVETVNDAQTSAVSATIAKLAAMLQTTGALAVIPASIAALVSAADQTKFMIMAISQGQGFSTKTIRRILTESGITA